MIVFVGVIKAEIEVNMFYVGPMVKTVALGPQIHVSELRPMGLLYIYCLALMSAVNIALLVEHCFVLTSLHYPV